MGFLDFGYAYARNDNLFVWFYKVFRPRTIALVSAAALL